VERGDIWWAELPPPRGPRPVVVLSRDLLAATRCNVTVAAISRTRRGGPTEVTVDERQGLATPSVMNLEDLITVPKDVLVWRMGRVEPAQRAAIRRGLLFSLALGSADNRP